MTLTGESGASVPSIALNDENTIPALWPFVPEIISPTNLTDIFLQVLPLFIAALGLMMVLMVAQIDLSRKLTEAIWHILTDNKPFAPAGATNTALAA